MSGLFSIGETGRPQGVSAQAYVDPSAGSGRQLAASAITTFGGVAKGMYEGYTIAGLTGAANTETEAGYMTSQGQLEVGVNDIEEVQDLSRLVAGVQQQAFSKEDAAVRAMSLKQQAVKRAPWLKAEIDSVFNNFFPTGSSSRSSRGSGIFQEDEQSAMINMVMKKADALYQKGELYLPPTANEQDIIKAVAEHDMKMYRNQQEVEAMNESVSKGIDLMFRNSSDKIDAVTTMARNILNDPNILPRDKEVLINKRARAMASQYMGAYNFQNMSNDQQRIVKDYIQNNIIDVAKEFSSEDYITGKLDTDVIDERVRNMKLVTDELMLQDVDTRVTSSLVRVFNASVSDLVSGGYTTNISKNAERVKRLLEASPEDKTDIAKGMWTIMSKSGDKPAALFNNAYTVGKAYTHEERMKDLSIMSERERSTVIHNIQNSVAYDLKPRLHSAVGNELTVLSKYSLAIEDGNVVLKGGEGVDPAIHRKVMKVYNDQLNGVLNSSYSVYKVDGYDDNVALSNFTSVLQLGGVAPTENLPTTGELVGGVAKQVADSTVSSSTEAGRLFLDILSPNKGERYSKFASTLDEKEKEAFETVRGFFENFQRGYKGGE